MAKIIYLIWFLFFFLSVSLVFFSHTDLWVSAFFFGNSSLSWRERNSIMIFFRSFFPGIIIFSFILTFSIGVISFFSKINIFSITVKKVIYLSFTLILGPGLIVESILKVFSGRVRPKEIIEFGGNDIFTPALVFSGQCLKNCSFVSGHAAIAFWLTAYAFIFPEPYRKFIFVFGFISGIFMSLFRIMEGAHFISDVVFSGLIVISINIITYYVFLHSRFFNSGDNV